MRIISGSHKGKRLTAPKGLPVRPTTDFAKEGLFNILYNRFHFSDVSLLDLFSGTGNISFEFGSRGCTKITSVDAHYNCVKYISKIAEELDFNIQAIKADVFKYLDSTRQASTIIFADPPYSFDKEELSKLLEKISENNLLEKDGYVIIEHIKHTDLSDLPNFVEARRYGGSVFSFFEKEAITN